MAEKPSLMDLDEFVESTILQIMRGVQKASNAAAEIDASAVVNPRVDGAYSPAKNIQFDVAVTVSGQNKAGGSAKVKVWGMVSVGGEGNHSDEHEMVSRVRFEVPVALPSRLFKRSQGPSGVVRR